jgi:hypothetical protein
MGAQPVDGPGSAPKQLHNAGPDEARDDTQNVVGDLRQRASEAEMNVSQREVREQGLGVGR